MLRKAVFAALVQRTTLLWTSMVNATLGDSAHGRAGSFLEWVNRHRLLVLPLQRWALWGPIPAKGLKGVPMGPASVIRKGWPVPTLVLGRGLCSFETLHQMFARVQPVFRNVPRSVCLVWVVLLHSSWPRSFGLSRSEHGPAFSFSPPVFLELMGCTWWGVGLSPCSEKECRQMRPFIKFGGEPRCGQAVIFIN